MSSLNRASLIGNVGKDPDIRFTQSGDPVASFSLATSEKWTNKEGEKQEKTQWHRVVVFGKVAQVVKDYVAKGRQLYVEGTIEYDKYTDKEGIERVGTQIKVSGGAGKIVLLGNGNKKGDEKPADDGWGSEPKDDEIPF